MSYSYTVTTTAATAPQGVTPVIDVRLTPLVVQRATYLRLRAVERTYHLDGLALLEGDPFESYPLS